MKNTERPDTTNSMKSYNNVCVSKQTRKQKMILLIELDLQKFKKKWVETMQKACTLQQITE